MTNVTMDNQQPSSTFDDGVIKEIESGKFDSRTKLFKSIGVRNKKAQRPYRDELDRLGLLKKYQNNQIDYKIKELKNLSVALGRVPRATDVENSKILSPRFFQNHFGSWNNAIREIFGSVNQDRYERHSNEQMLLFIRQFVAKYGKLPRRDEFDGLKEETPYYEAYFSRFRTTRWSDVISMVDLSGIKYHATKHGFGTIEKHDGKVYLSHQEYLIGKYLSENGIGFIQEVSYGPESGHRFDFYIPEQDLYIEYYGMSDDESYKARIEEKKKLYNGRSVLEIYKHDNTVKKLAEKVQRL